jgi:hypothetical protein
LSFARPSACPRWPSSTCSGFAGADTSVPLLVFVFLVALGIDYNIFLMTGVREESARSGARRGQTTPRICPWRLTR